jgi:hypothetical protein
MSRTLLMGHASLVRCFGAEEDFNHFEMAMKIKM